MLHAGKPGTLKRTASLQQENGWLGKDDPAGPFGGKGQFSGVMFVSWKVIFVRYIVTL